MNEAAETNSSNNIKYTMNQNEQKGESDGYGNLPRYEHPGA
jgi:hypothetical protein